MKDIYCIKCGKHVGVLNTPTEVEDKNIQNKIRKGTVYLCADCDTNIDRNDNNDTYDGTLETLKSLFGI